MAATSLFRLVCKEFERRYLLAELRQHGWNRQRTARDLGISSRSLYYKLAQHGLRPDDEVPEEYEGPDDAADEAADDAVGVA